MRVNDNEVEAEKVLMRGVLFGSAYLPSTDERLFTILYLTEGTTKRFGRCSLIYLNRPPQRTATKLYDLPLITARD